MDQNEINQLKALERHKNGGVGVRSVRTVIKFLEQGNISEACLARVYDGDKIDSYPDIKDWMDANLCDCLGKPPKRENENENEN